MVGGEVDFASRSFTALHAHGQPGRDRQIMRGYRGRRGGRSRPAETEPEPGGTREARVGRYYLRPSVKEANSSTWPWLPGSPPVTQAKTGSVESVESFGLLRGYTDSTLRITEA